MTTWGVVTTVKAREDQVLAFIAHHLSLGASFIWVYFDDPDDPVYAQVSKLPRVKAIRCTDWSWVFRGGRHPQLRNRQKANAQHAQRACKLDWLCHIDVDEFLFAHEPVAEILARVPTTVPSIIMEPFEAMHDPDLPDDIFTGRHFRGVLNNDHVALQPAIFGPFAAQLQKGSLGHAVGKSFCRPKVKGLVLRLHFVVVDGVVRNAPFHPGLRVLHFHAHDRIAWRRGLPWRLSRGAYRPPYDPELRSFLSAASDSAIDEFYDATMTLTPEKRALLEQHDRLITVGLRLRAKVEALRAGSYC